MAIRVNCLAALMATLFEVDPTSVLEEREGLHSLVEVELREAINDLLRRSADHYKATRRMIRSLSPSNIDFAIEVVQQLNTENSQTGLARYNRNSHRKRTRPHSGRQHIKNY